MENLINKSKLKKVLSKLNYRINSKNLNLISNILSENSLEIIEKILRNARISGRKTLRKEDIIL
jgi:histone H3/H4